MPPVSEAQRRAMFAASEGRSTLGIPKKVGEKFASADPGGKLPAKTRDDGVARLDAALQAAESRLDALARSRKDANEPSLRPAIKHEPTGRFGVGKVGQTHEDVQMKHFPEFNYKTSQDYTAGFANHKNQFLSRTRAMGYAKSNDLLRPGKQSEFLGDELCTTMLK